MKKNKKFIFILLCISLISLSAESKKKKKKPATCDSLYQLVSSINGKREVSHLDALRMMYYIQKDTKTAFSKDLVSQAIDDKLLFKETKIKESDKLTRGDLSLLIVNYLKIKGSLMNSVFKSGRYSYRLCVFYNLMPPRMSEWDKISGPELFSILRKVTKFKKGEA